MKTLDIPQANDLDTVRAVVRAVAIGGNTLREVVDLTGYSLRHTGYRLHAARVLGLLDSREERLTVTTLGSRLLATGLHSDQERAVFHEAVSRSKALSILVPDLLSPHGPAVGELTQRLVMLSALSTTTARRRAGGLLTWRRRILDLDEADRPPSKGSVQLSLFE